MKIFILLLLASFNTFAQDFPAVHGMLLFGKAKIYASHLPMFHSPHDYQVLLEIELQNNNEYLKSAKSFKGIHTLVPEPFVLTDLKKGKTSFNAQIFQGHFERGGKLIATTKISISQVLLFKKFKGEPKPKDMVFYVFGNETEQFMAHAITRAPDFDQVFQVAFPLNQKPVETVNFPNLNSTGAVKIVKEIYFEKDELAH